MNEVRFVIFARYWNGVNRNNSNDRIRQLSPKTLMYIEK